MPKKELKEMLKDMKEKKKETKEEVEEPTEEKKEEKRVISPLVDDGIYREQLLTRLDITNMHLAELKEAIIKFME